MTNTPLLAGARRDEALRRGARARRRRPRRVDAGEVLAILGDNGAGKSTLIKCISGVAPPRRAATIELDGEPVDDRVARRPRGRYGIETVYQDLALFDNLDPTANFYAGREDAGPRWLPGAAARCCAAGRWSATTDACSSVCRSALPDVDGAVGLMSGGQRQAVAVARAAAFASKRRHPRRADRRARRAGVAAGARPDRVACVTRGRQ